MSRLRTAVVAAITLALVGAAAPAHAQAAAAGWRLVPSPDPGPIDNSLAAVAAVSARDVWAVGQAGFRTLAEHWDGASWTVVPTPNPATGDRDSDVLNAVAAVASDDVWAVGSSQNGSSGADAALAMHWDGSRWSVVPTPDLPGAEPRLTSVTALSSSDVWAVGGRGSYTEDPALIEHWDGSRWSIVPAGPVEGAQCECSLSWVAGAAAGDLWAGGEFVILHWNGGAWTQPVIQDPPQQMRAASASSASNLWLAGACSYYQCSSPSTIAARFDGTAWRSSQPVSPSYYDNALNGVVALGPDDVWAVGTTEVVAPRVGSKDLTLAEHWNGSAWSVVPSANGRDLPYASNVLKAVAGVRGDLWAVGYFFDPADQGHQHTLIEHDAG